MKLESIQIKNYRSIEDISFDINPLEDETFTYGLIGVNEVGKSSILKAIALKDDLLKPISKDFRDKSIPIEIFYRYTSGENDVADFKNHLASKTPPINIDDVNLNNLVLKISFDIANLSQKNIYLEIENFSREDKNEVQEQLKQAVFDKTHKSIFWKAEDRYLISNPINLAEFKSAPDNISIPLKNCFLLSGITNIQQRIDSLKDDSTEIEQLQKELGEKVTEHIKNVWPNHPIEITFLISSGFINFHIKDSETESKAKTADQRSDGFKQFVSFLLTISAQDRNEELLNSILLLDEPETHLHPQAQEYLLCDIIKITKNKRNNIVFFATHSNYMIDKNDLSRNYRIIKSIEKKSKKEKTEKKQFDKKVSTYASVTYEVFDIPSTDYHNELYCRLHEIYQDEDVNDEKRVGILNFDTNFLNKKKSLKKDRPWKGEDNKATLPTYIRNCINHPDNGDIYKVKELKESVELLRSYL